MASPGTNVALNADRLATVLYTVAAKYLSHHGLMESNDLWSTVGELQQAVRNIVPEPIGSCLPLISVASRNHAEEIWSAFSGQDSELFPDARTVGYAYQYFRLPSRKQAQKNAQSADKQMDTEQLAAFTQLYTPYWVVDFLLQNTLLPQLSPDLRARLANHWLMESAPNEFSRTTSDITVLDPACGAGHFLRTTPFRSLSIVTN